MHFVDVTWSIIMHTGAITLTQVPTYMFVNAWEQLIILCAWSNCHTNTYREVGVEQLHVTCIYVITRVVNKTRNGTEWNGMERVNKTRNRTAESAQSTPTHPWPTELHPCKLFVHAERFAHSFSWKRMGRQADYSFHSNYIVDKQYS